MALVKTLLRKRVMLTLQPDEYDFVTRFARVHGKSRAAVFEDLFHELRPILERVVAATEAAQKAQVAAKEGLRASVERSEAVIESHAKAALSQFDWLLTQAEGTAPPAAGTDTAGGGSGAGGHRVRKRPVKPRKKAAGKRKRGKR